jgi:PAS domain S-box-containing protein
VGLYRATPHGEILDANPAMLSILAYPDKKTLLGINLRELHVQRSEYEQWQARLDSDKVALRHETQWRRFDGSTCWVENNARVVHCSASDQGSFEGSIEDITQRKEAENERERLIGELQEALTQIQTLGGLLPICASCKKIRDEEGRWNHIENYIQSHSEAEFTHSFCPDCVRILYPDAAPQLLKAE